jgi:hypothetical protein
MSVPVCRECDKCWATPWADEITGGEYYVFVCSPTSREIGTGNDESDALPKTSPRWCPLRGANKLPEPMREDD